MRFVLAALALLVPLASAQADGEPSHATRPDDHAPLGVMGDHIHHAGEWMLSYRYARMRMDGNRDGESRESVSDVWANFAVAPKDMDMEMHVFGVMVAPTDWVTLMAMLPLVELSMDHVVAMNGLRFTTKSDGIGDLKLSGLFRLFDDGVHHVHANAGVSFPTGTIRERDGLPTPMGPMEGRLPYPMQIGSGTFDLLPGLTYTGKIDWLSWGAQAIGTIRLDENRNDYRLGNRVDATAWVAHPWTSWVSTSARVAFSWWGNIDGRDDALNPAAVPTADPNRRAGRRVDLLGGVNFVVPLGPLGDQRFAAEAGFPIHQNLDGPQLETDWRFWVGWQKAF